MPDKLLDYVLSAAQCHLRANYTFSHLYTSSKQVTDSNLKAGSGLETLVYRHSGVKFSVCVCVTVYVCVCVCDVCCCCCCCCRLYVVQCCCFLLSEACGFKSWRNDSNTAKTASGFIHVCVPVQSSAQLHYLWTSIKEKVMATRA